MTELSEYAANVDVAIARESIRAVGKIALQQYDVNAIVDRLLQFLEMEKDYVTAETLVSIVSCSRIGPLLFHCCSIIVFLLSSAMVKTTASHDYFQLCVAFASNDSSHKVCRLCQVMGLAFSGHLQLTGFHVAQENVSIS